MNKAIYHISGFDCANCANKVESHLNKHKAVQSASIDFQNERLFITFRESPLNEEEILEVIKEVEDDPIRLEPISTSSHKKEPLFEKDDFILIGRIALSLILLVTAKLLSIFVFNDDERNVICIILYCLSLVVVLYDVLFKVFRNIIKRRNPIDEHLLMSISSLGAFSIAFFKDAEPVFFDGVLVMILFQIGELIEDILSKKSKQAISNAIDLRADSANLICDDKIVLVKPETLKIDDKILVRIGEIIPADGVVIDGNGTLDTSSLTGETMPIDVNKNSHVMSGSILKSGSITINVEKTFEDSTISKIMELVSNSGERKSKVDKFITKFAKIYTPIVLFIAAAFLIIFGSVSGNWSTALYRAVFVLIVGCPCAIVISVPLAYFAGIGLASKIGVVIKGANIMDELNNVGLLFVDKTGTLTYGNFEISKVVTNNIDEDLFMTYLLSAESRSNHPIAKAIILHKNTSELALKQENYQELAGYGTYTEYEGHKIYAGNRSLLTNNNIETPDIDEAGTVIFLAVDDLYSGYVVLSDIVRPKAKELVSRLSDMGIKTILLSGDTFKNVESVANEVGINEFHAGLLPQDKTVYVEKAILEKSDKKAIVFAGDGINDTPSIMRADVGFAMGGIGSDVAVENADAVIMQDHPLKIYHAIKIAKMTRRTAMFNIIFAISIKVVVMVLTLVINDFPPLIDALADTGLTVLLVINSLLLIYRKVK